MADLLQISPWHRPGGIPECTSTVNVMYGCLSRWIPISFDPVMDTGVQWHGMIGSPGAWWSGGSPRCRGGCGLGGLTTRTVYTSHRPPCTITPLPTNPSTDSSPNPTFSSPIQICLDRRVLSNVSKSFRKLQSPRRACWTHPFIMSSSPCPPLVHQAVTRVSKQHETHEYRQTMYHNGPMQQIAETRRHPRTIRKVDSAIQAYADWVLFPPDHTPAASRNRPVEVPVQHPSPRSACVLSNMAEHVTGAKKSFSGRPVIVQKVVSSKAQPAETHSPRHISRNLTPPPTPRLKRLPSPDFFDIDEEVAFCGCGVDAHVVQICKTCHQESDHWLRIGITRTA